ncbi:tRNA1(Val) (adenine(37)-N6)-methyltransferase [Tissierella sp. MSJ-40]|uniref:tRNA1(Val) (Adenine(37)-N6)-methyltransferase n=1 Tax=Tissierella simiarum TaxID=2841534 RepID=A0ABS6E2C3_9FIRM|nr:tRNA1(Val) (adenine(37)-N6)-methyltransferase [Tissierella simiarum]MBU5437055.1 tRNA1(Val) (adenine(37)-N6)-methyltransferase [Tissierella simiarum]
MEINLKCGERIDIVPGSNLKIIQNKDRFSYGTDAIFLSNFAKVKGQVIDLGTGTGIIPLRLYSKYKVEKIYGIEIQKEVANMAIRSLELNKLSEKIRILNMDLKGLPNEFRKSTFDVVTSNPPYMKAGSALVNSGENFAISRHEITCTLEDIMKVSEYLLKPGGKLYLVHRPDRLVDIVWTARKYNLEPKYMQFVQPKAYKKPNLLLIECSKGGKPDLKFKDPLIVYNEDGSYTEEILRIYGMDKEK